MDAEARPETGTAVRGGTESKSAPRDEKKKWVCDRCGSEMDERNCRIICPNCGNCFDCSDLNLYFD